MSGSRLLKVLELSINTSEGMELFFTLNFRSVVSAFSEGFGLNGLVQ